ncbi:MAG: hypothetical protein JO053_14355 [Acidobacteria bacterium]|nr:hypothetical protein [Acidobacteriota bacterium]
MFDSPRLLFGWSDVSLKIYGCRGLYGCRGYVWMAGSCMDGGVVPAILRFALSANCNIAGLTPRCSSRTAVSGGLMARPAI